MAEVSLAHFGQNLKTSKNKNVNFDPTIFFLMAKINIFRLNTIMKGYKSQSPSKFTKIYPFYHVPPPGGMSKNDEKSMIFDDFRRFWQNSLLSGAGSPGRDSKNAGRLSFDAFIGITFTIFFLVKIETIFRGSKLL